MRVFLAPIDIAGQARLTAVELEKRGHTARFFDGYASYLGYEEEEGQKYSLKELPSLADFDIFDVFFGAFVPLNGRNTFPKHLKFVHHFCGTDVRQFDLASTNNPYAVVKGNKDDSEKIRKHLKNLATVTDHCTLMDEELRPHVAPFFSRVHVIPRMVNVERYAKMSIEVSENGNKPIVVHASTHSRVKGTEHIVRAAEQLDNIEFLLIAGMRHNVAERIYAQSDIIIAQLNLDSYGILAIEGMAMGKIVITYLSPKMRKTYPPGLPIVSATRENLKEVLADVVSWPLHKKISVGWAGKEYVKKYHSTEAVMPKLIEAYKSL